MSRQKNKYSVSKVLNSKGVIIGYLSSKDEKNGTDIILDAKGYTVISL